MGAHLTPLTSQVFLAGVVVIAVATVVLMVGLCRTAARPAPTPPPDAAAAPDPEPVPPRAYPDTDDVYCAVNGHRHVPWCHTTTHLVCVRCDRETVPLSGAAPYDRELVELEQLWRAS